LYQFILTTHGDVPHKDCKTVLFNLTSKYSNGVKSLYEFSLIHFDSVDRVGVTHRLGHFNAKSLTGECWGKCLG